MHRRTTMIGTALAAVATAVRALPQATDSPKQLNALFERLMKENLDISPMLVTSLGMDTGERAKRKRQIDDGAKAGIERQKALIASQLARLRVRPLGSKCLRRPPVPWCTARGKGTSPVTIRSRRAAWCTIRSTRRSRGRSRWSRRCKKKVPHDAGVWRLPDGELRLAGPSMHLHAREARVPVAARACTAGAWHEVQHTQVSRRHVATRGSATRSARANLYLRSVKDGHASSRA
jgi:hypothetical protein